MNEIKIDGLKFQIEKNGLCTYLRHIETDGSWGRVFRKQHVQSKALTRFIEKEKKFNSKIITKILKEYNESDYYNEFDDVESSLAYAVNNSSLMYQEYVKGHVSLYRFLKITCKAHNRHVYTDYDKLLAKGCDKETAREMIATN